MAVKTITITEDAYNLLARAKAEGESFTELFKRTFTRKKTIAEIGGYLGTNETEAEAWKRTIKESRKKETAKFEENYARIRNIRTH